MAPPFPLSRYLVPPPAPDAPDGFTPSETKIANGLPHYVDLSPRLRLKLTVPTGLARQWLEADGATVVSASADQAAPFDPANPTRLIAGQTPRLSLIQDGQLAGTAALMRGPVWRFPQVGGAAIEVMVLDWRISAGALCGPISDGSFLRLGWRRADQSVANFGPPPTSEFVILRWPPILRIESLVNRDEKIRYRGHLLRSFIHGRA